MLACLCAVPIEVMRRLVGGERPDPVLIMCKSVGWGWPAAKAIITTRPGGPAVSSHDLDAAHASCELLAPATARHVMRFWQARTPKDRRQPMD